MICFVSRGRYRDTAEERRVLFLDLAMAQIVESAGNTPVTRDGVSSLGQEDLLEKGHGNPLQWVFSCLENPMDGGAWRATIPVVAKSQTLLSNTLFLGVFFF